MTCPACGLELPSHAHFCARCGVRLPSPGPAVEMWVLVVFGVGVVLTAATAVLYAGVAMDPTVASTGLDASTVRTGSILIGAVLAILCALQSAAITGLVRGRDWGRVVATVACVVWSATCIGLPVAVLVLNSLWRRKPPPAQAARPLF
ncbi:MAG TPA: zinc ribbon domain-containing protein [Candidatus Dormibacteraeota bacterium]|nr:zinc ribbon domain-containing protein [Candidatus Dormibacteraeota bacterium]